MSKHIEARIESISLRYHALTGQALSRATALAAIANLNHPVQGVVGASPRETLAMLNARSLPAIDHAESASVARFFSALGERAAVALDAVRGSNPAAFAALSAALRAIEATARTVVSRGSLDDAAWLHGATVKAGLVSAFANELGRAPIACGTTRPRSGAASTRTDSTVALVTAASELAKREGVAMSEALKRVHATAMQKTTGAR